MKNVKRYLSIFMVIAMIIAMTACGSKEKEAAEPDQAETEAEAADVESEPEAGSEDVQAEAPAENVETEEVNEFGFTESQVAALYASIKDSVAREYLEPNGINPTEFAWPDGTDPLWRYIPERLDYYSYANTADLLPDDIGSDYDTSLAEAVFNGIITWTEQPENGFDTGAENKRYILAIKAMLTQSNDTIPANVTFE